MGDADKPKQRASDIWYRGQVTRRRLLGWSATGAGALGACMPAHKAFFEDAGARLKQIDPSGPLPDRYVQSNYEALNAVKLCIEKSNNRGREDTTKLIEALEGLEMKEGEDFPQQGDKLLRKEDHQAFLREFIFDIKGGKHHIIDVVPREKTVVPASCKFA